MVWFYVVAGALALIVAVALARPLIRGAGGAASREARDADLYRDQLDEIERDLARGAISPDEAEGARAEVSRRLLAAAERAGAARALNSAPRGLSRLAAGLALVGAPLLAAVVYVSLGAPGLPDRHMVGRGEAGAGMERRLSQAEAESLVPARDEPSLPPQAQDYAEQIARLEQVMEQRPDDAEGLELLATGYARLGRYAESWRTYERLIELLGAEAGAEHYAAMAEAMVVAAGGYVSPEAEAALDAALARDPSLPTARYYDALGLAQAGRLDQAIAAWERLRAETPEGAPWLAFLESTLAEARALRDGAPGPSSEQMAAAESLTPEERQAMIEGMVARLEARLTSEGGEPEEWLRLMNAYVQLDRPEEAERIARLGIAAFGKGSEAAFLREQALLMGLDPGKAVE